jgi:tRNA nucleotidyltransferase (CCA-adding enzyme)
MEKPYVQGRDLIEAGLAPGENFGKLLDYAHKLRVSGVEKTEALKATLAFSRNKKK